MSDFATDEIQHIPSATPDFQTDLARKLHDLAPEAVTDGKIDVKKLQELLDSDTTDDSERFGLFWPGKKRAMRAAQEPTTATLKPAKDESKDWDTTENIFIEGDNLETLKILQKYYHNKIKMIYIDPPYNTGKDFVYPDNFKEGLQNYLEFSKQVDEGGKKISTNSDTEGRYHSNWLNMMYPRLKLARNLLTNDGAIFISIDDSELANLKQITNEIFGEDNFVGAMVWAAGRKNDSRYISSSHEYILCYARSIRHLEEKKVNWQTKKKGLDNIQAEYSKLRRKFGDDHAAVEKQLKSWYSMLPESDPSKRHRHYSYVDARGIYFPSDLRKPQPTSRSRYDILHPHTGKPVNMHPNGWSFAPERMEALLADDRIRFGIDETTRPTLKVYLLEADTEAPYSVFYQDGRGASKRLNDLMGAPVFDFPKDETIIESLIEMTTSGQDIVLDFFAGSATTAHSVMALNAKDGLGRRFIQVQLPEPTPQDSPARKAGFKTIAALARMRIELAGQKVLADNPSKLALRSAPLDIGFKVFKLADSNFTKWQSASETDKDSLQQHLLDIRESSNDAATEEELLTEVLLKQGISLTAKLKHEEISGLSVWNVGDTTVLAYLNEHVKPTLDQLRAVAAAAPAKIIILEDAFKGDDELKTNLTQICKTNKIELWTV